MIVNNNNRRRRSRSNSSTASPSPSPLRHSDQPKRERKPKEHRERDPNRITRSHQLTVPAVPVLRRDDANNTHGNDNGITHLLLCHVTRARWRC
jgi:hypothetical protein